MQQREWIFNGNKQRHIVEVFHDFGTEQIFIKLNRVLLNQGTLGAYDTDKRFNFFIDGELCEIVVKRSDGQIHYDFIPHAHSTSQFGRQRKWKDLVTNYGLGGILIALFLLMGGIATYFAIDFGERKDIQKGGIIGLANISQFDMVRGASGAQATASYIFSIGRKRYTGSIPILQNKKGDFISSSGLLLSVGDQFEVLFASQRPNKSRLLLNRPSTASLNNYKLKVRASCLAGQEEKDATDAAIYCDCLRYHTYQLQGIEGLNQLYFQHHTPEESARFNQKTYQDFMQSAAVQKIITYCESLN